MKCEVREARSDFEAGAGDETAARIHVFGAASLNSHKRRGAARRLAAARRLSRSRDYITAGQSSPSPPFPLLQAAYVSVALHFPRNCPGNAPSSLGMRDAHREHRRAVSWTLNFHRAALPRSLTRHARVSISTSFVRNREFAHPRDSKLHAAYELRTS